MFMAYTPIRRLAGANNIVQQALSAAERVFAVLDMENEFQRDHGRKEMTGISRSLEFKHVSLRYETADQPALIDINLTMQAGEILALVGSSGSGKSKLV